MAARTRVLARLPLFSCFTPAELRKAARDFVEVAYRRGDAVCRQGDEGDCFFVVLSGELEVWGGAGNQKVISRLGPGECLGEMSLLTGAKRSATVTVAKSARLLALKKADFDRLLLQNPKAIEYLSRILAKRLATMARGEVAARTTTAIGVTGRPGLKGKTLVASALAGLLERFSERDAVLVSVGRSANHGRRGSEVPLLADLCQASTDDILGRLRRDDSAAHRLAVEVRVTDDEQAQLTGLGALVATLGARFPFVVLDLGSEGEALGRSAEDLCDVVVTIVDRFEPTPPAESGTRPRTFQVVNLHNPNARELPLNHCEPFVVRDDPELRRLDPCEQARAVRDRPRSLAAPPLHRLARKILGTSVGVALGGGAAFGVAHIGVLKVLEDHHIPVDLLAGCSMGSVVAVGYAAGLRAREMVDIAGRLGTKWTTLSALDFTLTKPAFLAGRRLVKILAPLTGPVQTFEQLALPCRTVATDIETGELVAIGSGRLDAAFRASSAVPMVFAPVMRDGRTLVDGAVVDPVPAAVARDMGADVCIAVNVVPPLKKGVDTILSRMSKLVKQFDPLAYLSGSRGMPNMLDLVMNSMQALQHELGNFKAIAADVRINPDLSRYTWIEFYRAGELIERGAEAAERAVPEIKRVLAERLAETAGGARGEPTAARLDAAIAPGAEIARRSRASVEAIPPRGAQKGSGAFSWVGGTSVEKGQR